MHNAKMSKFILGWEEVVVHYTKPLSQEQKPASLMKQNKIKQQTFLLMGKKQKQKQYLENHIFKPHFTKLSMQLSSKFPFQFLVFHSLMLN